eukprot:CAMPEP_0196724334 /NCGR_PEP_ID=MMETSP1091-20130531/6227_1 /TAXON_ID=302021 /ORGANISM="Rhodomonas sp., Strain CCMP768" /LENGTH=310 /DNA_ID=CAMNT_0042066443 /DNA_START=134 /DNA_END=1067 /DNA_ORIENTATION=+
MASCTFSSSSSISSSSSFSSSSYGSHAEMFTHQPSPSHHVVNPPTIPTSPQYLPTDNVVIRPRRRKDADAEGSEDLNRVGALIVTREVLCSLFSLPLSSAADRLGISVTSLKKICRGFGIRLWPYRFQQFKDKSVPAPSSVGGVGPENGCVASEDGGSGSLLSASTSVSLSPHDEGAEGGQFTTDGGQFTTDGGQFTTDSTTSRHDTDDTPTWECSSSEFFLSAEQEHAPNRLDFGCHVSERRASEPARGFQSTLSSAPNPDQCTDDEIKVLLAAATNKRRLSHVTTTDHHVTARPEDAVSLDLQHFLSV